MIIINFGKWEHKATSLFIYERIYKNHYKWTPFVQVSGRYIRKR